MFSPVPFYDAFGMQPETPSGAEPISFRLGEVAELVITPRCCSLIFDERASHDLSQAALLHFGARTGLAVAQTTGARLCFHWSEDCQATSEAQVLSDCAEILEFIRTAALK